MRMRRMLPLVTMVAPTPQALAPSQNVGCVGVCVRPPVCVLVCACATDSCFLLFVFGLDVCFQLIVS